MIGVDEQQIAADYPIELAEVGPRFVLIPVRDLAALQQAQLDAVVRQRLLDNGVGVQCVVVFSADAYPSSGAQYAARMFFESAGIREDPATGSANSAFAAYLRKHRGEIGQVIVDQGVEIKRPSRLYLDVASKLRVGGKVQPVVQGQLALA